MRYRCGPGFRPASLRHLPSPHPLAVARHVVFRPHPGRHRGPVGHAAQPLRQHRLPLLRGEEEVAAAAAGDGGGAAVSAGSQHRHAGW